MLLIVGAQFLASFQLLWEERSLKKYDVSPLLAVGIEGTWGVLVCGLVLLAMYFIPGEDAGSLENIAQTIVQSL